MTYIIDLMLGAGAKIWKPDNFGTTPLWYATIWRNPEAFEASVGHGAEMFEADEDG